MKKTNNIQVDLQSFSHDPHPSYADFKQWVDAVFAANSVQRAAVGIRVVDEEESAKLNEFYRHKSGPTNVLSFSYTPPPGMNLMGDLALCAPIVIKEAKAQNKPIVSHWAHLTIHGSLHLLGFDHIQEHDAAEMEQMEIDILQKFGFGNPYE